MVVYAWFAEFKRGRASANVECRECRPRAACCSSKYIDVMRKMIETDPHVTYRNIRTTICIDMKQIHEILHTHLAVKKIGGRWIPK